MKALFKLEWLYWGNKPRQIHQIKELAKPWVAEIIGYHDTYHYSRKFIKGKIDFTDSNRLGSKRVFLYFMIEENKLYELKKGYSRISGERYFFHYSNGKEHKVPKEDIERWVRKNI